MATDIFSNLVSIGNGLHKDNNSNNQYQIDFQNLKHEIKYESNPIYNVDIKNPLAIKEKYYFKLITKESQKIYNEMIADFHPQATHPELQFSYTVFFNRLEQYLLEINTYLSSRTLNNDDSKIINFLRVNVIHLFMELQEQFTKFASKDYISLEEVYEHYFKMVPPETSELILSNLTPVKIPINKKKVIKSNSAFKYRSSNTAVLLKVLKNLQLNLDLLNENRGNIDQLHELLISPDFSTIDNVFHIACETTQFSYIVSMLKPFFINFNPTSIEHSKKFITKTGVLLKASNLHKNKVHNTKEKEEIDRIIKQLQ